MNAEGEKNLQQKKNPHWICDHLCVRRGREAILGAFFFFFLKKKVGDV